MSDPVESAINAEHSRQERAWNEAMNPTAQIVEALEPFARAIDTWGGDRSDPQKISVWEHPIAQLVSVEDFWRAHDALTQSKAIEPTLLRQLRELAVSLHGKHYPEVTQWQPLDDEVGILSQIDNMTTGLVRAIEPSEDEVRELVKTLRHNAKCLDQDPEFAEPCEEAADLIERLSSLPPSSDAITLQKARNALQFAYDMHKRARDTIPDEEEGLAAQVFCHHINHADGPIIEAIAALDTAMRNAQPQPGSGE